MSFVVACSRWNPESRQLFNTGRTEETMTQLPADELWASTNPEAVVAPSYDHQSRTEANLLPQSAVRGWKLFVGALAVAVISGVIGATAVLAVDPFGSQHTGSSASTDMPVTDLPDISLERAAARAAPSVVKLETQAGVLSQAASGVVLTADGLIMTNAHVVSALGDIAAVDAPQKTVAMFTDGRIAPIIVVGADPASDIAVVRAQGISGLTPITLGSSADVRIGQKVVSVGSPLGLENTVTTGIVSALHRPVPVVSDAAGDETVLDAIQTDAAMNPGSLGGALTDRNGNLIGLNSVIATVGNFLLPGGSIGLGFAIPIDQAKRVAAELIATGKASHAHLGVQLASDRGIHGAKVVAVESGSPAAAAGLVAGATVTRIDERTITSADALVAAILSKTPGDAATLTYLDTVNTAHTVRVTLSAGPEWQTHRPGPPDRRSS
ncbi:peptidase S1 and S6, chymotrypsin/Hap [Mycobacterium xenopi RIVM700367]|nr:peptidase S1 and S6, chymotrypsin/Hap [Mycobacterium xenopi RIVM700367]